MVENLSQASAKIIVETSDFLSEMISESPDSPPMSLLDKTATKTTSNARTRDCLKVAQSTNDNKLAKKAKNNNATAERRLAPSINSKSKDSHKDAKRKQIKGKEDEKEEEEDDDDDDDEGEKDNRAKKKKKKKEKRHSHKDDEQDNRSRSKTSSHGRKGSDETVVKSSKDSSKVTSKNTHSRSRQAEPAMRSKSNGGTRTRVREKRRYEEIIIDNITINAFRTWEDLQDEINDRISANLYESNPHNPHPTISPASDEQHRGSTSQATCELSTSAPLSPDHRQVISGSPKRKFSETEAGRCADSGSNKAHLDAIRSILPGSPCKIKLEPQSRDGASQHAETPCGDGGFAAQVAREQSLPYNGSGESISGPTPNSHRALQHERREHERPKSSKIRHPPAFAPPPPGPPLGNNYEPHSNYLHHLHQPNPPSAPFGSPMSTATNQYLSQYFNSGAYSQQQHHQSHNPYGLPPLSQPYLAPPPPPPMPPPPPTQSHMLASSPFASPYASPYTITDTIISRQTIIPPSMGMAGARYHQFPPPLPAAAAPPPPPPSIAQLDHNSAMLMRQAPHYMPSPTERSFMEFARSYASASNMSSLLNQQSSSSLPGGSGGGGGLGPAFNPNFDRFGLDSRAAAAAAAFAASKAYGGPKYGDPLGRFGIPIPGQHHGDAGPAASFFPQHHYFR